MKADIALCAVPLRPGDAWGGDLMSIQGMVLVNDVHITLNDLTSVTIPAPEGIEPGIMYPTNLTHMIVGQPGTGPDGGNALTEETLKVYRCKVAVATNKAGSWVAECEYDPLATAALSPLRPAEGIELKGLITRYGLSPNATTQEAAGVYNRLKWRSLTSPDDGDNAYATRYKPSPYSDRTGPEGKCPPGYGWVKLTYGTSQKYISIERKTGQTSATTVLRDLTKGQGQKQVAATLVGIAIDTPIKLYQGGSSATKDISPGDNDITTYLIPVNLMDTALACTIGGVSTGLSLDTIQSRLDDSAGLPSDQLIDATITDLDLGSGSWSGSNWIPDVPGPGGGIHDWTGLEAGPYRAVKAVGSSCWQQYQGYAPQVLQYGSWEYLDWAGRVLIHSETDSSITVVNGWDELGVYQTVHQEYGATVINEYPKITTLADTYIQYEARQLKIDEHARDLAINKAIASGIMGTITGGANMAIGAKVSAGTGTGPSWAGPAGFAVGSIGSLAGLALNVQAIKDDFRLDQERRQKAANSAVATGASWQILRGQFNDSYVQEDRGVLSGFCYFGKNKSFAWSKLHGISCNFLAPMQGAEGAVYLTKGSWQGDLDFSGHPRPDLLSAMFLEGVRVV